MHAIRRFIRITFGFSRKETNGFIILIPLILLIIFSQPIYQAVKGDSGRKDFTPEKRTLDSLTFILSEQEPAPASDVEKPVLFSFDPNTATVQELEKLGFPAIIANRIEHYRARGGRFFEKKDILKIYGMDSLRYQELEPYIKLPANRTKHFTDHKETSIDRKGFRDKPVIFIDLNQADSIAFQKVYGIGPILASRIVRYREKLGGFLHKDQLHEVYGLDSLVITQLSEISYIQSAFSPRLVNLNLLSEKELASHPYISKTIAKAIVTYRFQHGSFTEVKDIRNIVTINETSYLKMEPYLTVK